MKTNIGVFFGGNSVEHEVAVISALQAIQNIDKNLYDVTPIYIAKNGKMYSGEVLLDINNFKNICFCFDNKITITLESSQMKCFSCSEDALGARGKLPMITLSL